MEKKGLIENIAEGFAESTRTVHEINKENFAAVKADSKACFEAAAAPDPGLEKVRRAKGLSNKIKVIGKNIVEGARENTENERERRAEIQNHESYKTLLEEQRIRRQKTVKRPN